MAKKRTLKQQRPIELDRLLTDEWLREADLSPLSEDSARDPELEKLVSEVRKRNQPKVKRSGSLKKKIKRQTLRKLA
jgi:hypothetical protein